MLPKAQRFDLRRHPDFFTKAKRIFSPKYTFWKLVVDEKQPAQGGVIVPKKVAPLATRRNYLKRRVRALLSPTLSRVKGVAIVMSVNRDLESADWKNLEQDLQKLVK